MVKDRPYIWMYKHVGFQGGVGGPNWGNRKPIKIEFESKTRFDKWFRDLQIGLAELDEVMNYCEYFVRTEGNDGKYVREGKEHEVHGEWDGYHIVGSALFPHKGFDYKLVKSFREFISENEWDKDWFKLRDKYVKTT